MKNHLSKSTPFLFLACLLSFSCNQNRPTSENDWTFTPFTKVDSVNPILGPIDTKTFTCPVRETSVKWEAKDVFNPSAVVKNGKIFLLYRAEDSIGKLAGTSRIGIAVSEDGLHFKRNPKPVLYPEKDDFIKFEWEGGCEDPRVIEDKSGMYYMTYTAWNGDKPRLFIATSKDLFTWDKYGSVFSKAYEGKYTRIHSKSGAIVCKRIGDRIVAVKIKGKYWMYFGDTDIFLAYSEDLINWTPLEKTQQELLKNKDLNRPDIADLFSALIPRKGKFDSELVESGPFALLTKKGILLLYNSKNSKEDGDPTLPPGTYAAGQALFDSGNPEKLLARTKGYFFKPDKPYEITGQVNNVCFVEGLAHFKSKWFLYYGTADSKIATAIYTPED